MRFGADTRTCSTSATNSPRRFSRHERTMSVGGARRSRSGTDCFSPTVSRLEGFARGRWGGAPRGHRRSRLQSQPSTTASSREQHRGWFRRVVQELKDTRTVAFRQNDALARSTTSLAAGITLRIIKLVTSNPHELPRLPIGAFRPWSFAVRSVVAVHCASCHMRSPYSPII